MNVTDMLQQTGAVGAISRELGIDPATAEAGAAALLPSILSGFQNPAAAAEPQSAIGGGTDAAGGGLGALLGTISALGGGGLLDNVTANAPSDVGQGNQILGQIFGSKDESRAVAAQAASQSGVEPSLLKKMLPLLAMAAAGYVMKQAGQGQGSAAGGSLDGGLSGMLGSILGGQTAPARGGSEPAPSASILGDLIGAAGKYLAR
ncbi:DUF937 domain-containing protein [Sphingomonas sp. URHD0057]|uniref:DUF937 domain-containing protein n=1 Tax=Sphingomonas sp. URHD0057 TaxID=1380389 RepID=UPI00048EFE68|nr:DUF937 domain-containing protein [Sphingomonas sp. URHD0057]